MTIKKDRYNQVNIRLTADHKAALQKDWQEFCSHGGNISFNEYCASFLKIQDKGTDPLFPICPVGSCFIDDRGTIQNILNRDIKAVALITSKKGTERSNHWHKSDWHYLYVLSGELLYYERDIGNKGPGISVTVHPGQMIFTAPNKVHKTVFTEDTVLLSLGNYVDHDKDTIKEKF